MSLFDQVSKDIIAAMKAKDKIRLEALRNIKKYLLTTLFNAPSTMSGYYQAEVNHDFPQYAVIDK